MTAATKSKPILKVCMLPLTKGYPNVTTCKQAYTQSNMHELYMYVVNVTWQNNIEEEEARKIPL